MLACHTKKALMRLPISFLLFPLAFVLFLLCFLVPRTCYWTAPAIFLLLSRSTLHLCPPCPPIHVADLCGLQHVNLPSGFQFVWPVVSPMGIPFPQREEREVWMLISPASSPQGVTGLAILMCHCSSEGALSVLCLFVCLLVCF